MHAKLPLCAVYFGGMMDVLGRDRVFETVNRTIAPGDGMVNGDEPHYFRVGASAMVCIDTALSAAKIQRKQIKHVLDYGCGYGRVMRWLMAEFPESKILGVDADPKAAEATHVVLGVETRKLDISLRTPFELGFDLIWVGSLLTHLPADESLRVLTYLSRSLNAGGLVVFTTHGNIVERRLRTRERDYNLPEDRIHAVISEIGATGYGFSAYPKMENYGISVSRPWRIAQMCEKAALTLVHFQDRGWASHQDVFSATRS